MEMLLRSGAPFVTKHMIPRNPWQSMGILATSLLALAYSPSVLAHAALVKSEPARRAALAKPPQQVRLWFNERIEPAYATIQVYREDGVPLVLTTARVDPADGKLLVVDLPKFDSGTYTVKYRVLSVDGHTVDYGYTFSVKGPTRLP